MYFKDGRGDAEMLSSQRRLGPHTHTLPPPPPTLTDKECLRSTTGGDGNMQRSPGGR